MTWRFRLMFALLEMLGGALLGWVLSLTPRVPMSTIGLGLSSAGRWFWPSGSLQLRSSRDSGRAFPPMKTAAPMERRPQAA
jgi:hypothetical protein